MKRCIIFLQLLVIFASTFSTFLGADLVKVKNLTGETIFVKAKSVDLNKTWVKLEDKKEASLGVPSPVKGKKESFKTSVIWKEGEVFYITGEFYFSRFDVYAKYDGVAIKKGGVYDLLFDRDTVVRSLPSGMPVAMKDRVMKDLEESSVNKRARVVDGAEYSKEISDLDEN